LEEEGDGNRCISKIMKNHKKRIWIAGLGFILVLSLAFLVFPGEKKHEGFNIGVPDDSASYIFRYMIEEKKLDGQLSTMLGVYPIKDCCTSTSEWALSTDNLDMSVICPDAARRLLEKDERYVILGPCMINSDILVLHNESSVKRVGITQNRDYQAELIRQCMDNNVEVCPMLSYALPYAYHEEKIDGVVVDVSAALRMEGRKEALRQGRDTVTYVLVVRKDYLQDASFRDFVNHYNQMLTELENEEQLQRIVNKYAGYTCTGKEASEWKRMNVRYQLLTIPATN